MRITLLVLAAAFAMGATKMPPAADRKVDFEKDVQPLLEQKCYSCHSEEAQQSGLRLDKRQNALRGGDYGPVILPGNSAESKLIKRLVNGDGGLQMPPTGALSDDEIGVMRAWIDQGADFRNQVEDKPATPIDPKLAALIRAVRSHEVQAVAKQIAENPSLVNAHDRAGTTPLMHAAGFGNIATMKLLMRNGADVNVGNKRKSTPLLWSLHDEAKVRLLLDRGAKIDARTVDGRTAVYQAASMGNAVSVLKLLLDKGADPNARSINGMTPLMAAAHNSLEAEKLLVEHKADVNAVNASGVTALMLAAQTGRPAGVRMLIEKGADPNLRTKKNETALADAATAGNEECVKLLLDHHAEVNVQDIRGYSPLLYAAGSDAMPAGVVKMLLAKGADLSAKGDDESARMLAAKRGDTEVARVLGVPEDQRKLLGVAYTKPSGSGERAIGDSVKRAFGLLEKQSHNFIRIGGCNSCHAQDLPSAAAAIARDHGLPAPAEIPQLPQSVHALNPERIMDLAVVATISPGWEMFDFGMNRVPGDEYTDATVRFFKSMQTKAGNWDVFQSRRPPMASGVYQTAAMAIYTLKIYGPPAEKADTDRALARAAAWLESAKPETTQDRAFHLLGLAWSNANREKIAIAAKALAATQLPDGSYRQLPTMESDAYATGQALYALSIGGQMPASNPVYVKGVKYLLDTQAADGSWHVKSRSIWLQPYFDSGFPYAQDQWISAAGTAWATMALSMAADPRQSASTAHGTKVALLK